MDMADLTEEKSELLCMKVSPGVCGFQCPIKAQKIDKHKVSIENIESDCKQIQQMSRFLDVITLKNVFAPVSRNPVFRSAEKAGCHASCIVPMAVLRLVEVAMGMALPGDACIAFKTTKEGEKG